MCTRFDSEVNLHTSTWKLVTTLNFMEGKNICRKSEVNVLEIKGQEINNQNNQTKS